MSNNKIPETPALSSAIFVPSWLGATDPNEPRPSWMPKTEAPAPAHVAWTAIPSQAPTNQPWSVQHVDAPFAAPPLLVAECTPDNILTKRFTADGTKIDFEAGYVFRYHEFPAGTWPALLESITRLTGMPRMCLLRGALHPEYPRGPEGAPRDQWYHRRTKDRPNDPACLVPASFNWVVYDFDETSTPFELAQPDASIRAWHSTLPPELRAASSAFFPSSSAHRSPTVRGKLVVWYGSPITGEQARDFASLYGADPSVGWCYQPNFFAAPVFDGCSDPLAGARAPIVFEGNDATQPPPSALKAHRDRPAPVTLGECPPGDKGILTALGPAEQQDGRRFHICGHVGGLMRKLGFKPEDCAAILREWLAAVPGADIEHGVDWAVAAWNKPADAVSGETKLRETVGNAHADVIVEACTRARPPPPPPSPEESAALAAVGALGERERAQAAVGALGERERAQAAAAASSTPAPIAVLASDRSWIKNGAAAFDERPPIPFLIEELAIAPGPPTMVVALGYVGKSLILLSLLLSIASGRIPVWGLFSVTRPGRSIFLDYEGPDVLLQERMQRLAVGMGLSRDVTAMIDHGRPPVYLDGNREYVKAWLVATLTGYVAAVVDSFRVACPMLEENDSRAGIPLDLLAEVSEITGCVVFVIHHASKPSKDSDGEVNPRGSTALFNACGTVLTLSSDDPEGPKRVQHTKAKFARRPVAPFMIRIEDLPAVGKLEPVRVVALDKANHEANELSMNEARILEALKAAPGPFLSIGETKADRAPGRLMAACKMGSKAFDPAFASLKERSERFPHVEGLEDRGKGLARTVTYRKAGRLSPSAIEALQREP